MSGIFVFVIYTYVRVLMSAVVPYKNYRNATVTAYVCNLEHDVCATFSGRSQSHMDLKGMSSFCPYSYCLPKISTSI